MLDTTETTDHQRAKGRVAVALDAQGRVLRLAQVGSGKAFVHTHGDRPTEVVFLNTSGGLTSGDRIELALDLPAGLTAMASTQTAERAYAARGPAAQARIDLTLGAGANLSWLPQETLLFQNSALARETRVDLGAGASLVACESLILGRQAHGEDLRHVNLSDLREVWQNRRLLWRDRFHLTDAVLAYGGSPALLAGARALGLIVVIGPAAEAAAPHLRAVLGDSARVGFSAWEGRVVVRLLADSAWDLRLMMTKALTSAMTHPLPRMWALSGGA